MKKILIVDDQAGWRNFNANAVHEVLGDDVEIITASSAEEGYNCLLEFLSNPFDYILTDMQMEEDYVPKMAGEWLIEQTKTLAQYKNTKIIIISATMNVQSIADGYGVECIPKRVAVASLDSYKELLKN